ncbi:hypothetical protein ECAE60S_04159 [Eoetvoesiella caeni]
MKIREYLKESADFLRGYITIESMIFYLAKKEGLTAQEVAAWFLQTGKYSDLMTFKIDRTRGVAEIFYDPREAEPLVLDCLRIIAEHGVSAKLGVKQEDGLAWQIEDFNARFPSLSFEGGEIPLEEYTVSGSPAKELDVRERESLLKLLIGMAAGRYRHELGAKKSVAVTPILQDVERLGLAVSSETVRKYLKEAERLLRSA